MSYPEWDSKVSYERWSMVMYDGTQYIYVPAAPEYKTSKVGVPPNKDTRVLEYQGQQMEVRTWIPYYLYDTGGFPASRISSNLPDVLKKVRGIYGDSNITISAATGYNGTSYFMYDTGLTMSPMMVHGNLPMDSDREKAKDNVFPEGTNVHDLNGFNVEYDTGYAKNPQWSYNFAQQRTQEDPGTRKQLTYFPQPSPQMVVENTIEQSEDGGSLTTYYATNKQEYAVANLPRTHAALIAWYRAGGRKFRFQYKKHWLLVNGQKHETAWIDGELTTGDFREGFGESNVPYAIEIKPYPGPVATSNTYVEVKETESWPAFQLVNFFEND